MRWRTDSSVVEVPARTLTDFVFQDALEFGDSTAIVDATTGERYSYLDLHRLVNGLACGLAEWGLCLGDRAALISSNTPDYPIVFHGVLAAGGVVTTLNPLYTAEEIAHQLSDSGARIAFAAADHVEKVHEAAQFSDSQIEEVVAVGTPDGPMGTGRVLDDLLMEGKPPTHQVDPAKALAALPYSSGTTGRSKGVMLTHRNLVANVVQTAASQAISSADVVAAVLPFFHIYGMTVLMNYGLRKGAKIVTLPRYDAKTLLKTLQDFQVTRLYAVPPIILDLAKRSDLDLYNLAHLEQVLSGAAPLDPETAQAAAERIGCPVTQGYGLTEASPCTHLTPFHNETVPPASIGPPVPGTECRVVDPATGMDVEPRVRGELWVRGPQVMPGYLNNPEATAEMLDEDGFLHTGDVAVVDENNNYFIVDRLKELIKYKGHQIAPAELEAVLVSHAAVRDAAVIGVPDAEAGEIPRGLVVLASWVPASELLAYVSERVAPHKRLRELQIVESIPRSASGKILRRELR